MIKGDLPWRYKANIEIFNRDGRLKTKESEIKKYLSTLDDTFTRCYKYIKNTLESLQTPLDSSHYKTIRDHFSEMLFKHITDTDFKYDWFPILQKIQKFNRK